MIKNLIAQDAAIFGSAIAVSIIMVSFSVLVTWLGLIPAKHVNEVTQGKRRVATIIAGILGGLMIVGIGFLLYFAVVGTLPSLITMIVLVFIGTIFGTYQGIKLYYIQIVRLETYQLLSHREVQQAKNDSRK